MKDYLSYNNIQKTKLGCCSSKEVSLQYPVKKVIRNFAELKLQNLRDHTVMLFIKIF